MTITRPTQHFVAFIDILGFRELIKKDNGTGTSLAIIKDAVELATNQLKSRQKDKDSEHHFWFDAFKVKSFSDCFCFSVPLEFEKGEKDYKQNLLSFCVWIEVFYNTLLGKGFLCRGGITQGWHYVDDDLIFSQAQVEAFELESTKATHPIIMIHPNLLKEIRDRHFVDEPYYSYMFAHDQSGRNFLNPFNYGIIDQLFFGPETQEAEANAKRATKILMQFQEIVIEDKMREFSGNVFIDKYQWLKEFMAFVLRGSYSDKFTNGLRLDVAL
jgi:hypothetical protein